VKFGQKVIEVATFRRQVAPGEEIVQDGVPAPVHHSAAEAEEAVAAPATSEATEHRDHLMHRDNTFGTPEEDAFRRDFTINALFYDIATFSIIDYVGGLEDLRAGIVRSIGDPEVRFREDPVRMLRAVALAARLDFTIDKPVVDAIQLLRHEIARAAPPRMLEEYYKILRGGSSERTFRELARLGLLEPISAELHHGAAESLWESLTALDLYRRRFKSTPDTLSNAILMGSLLAPLGLSPGEGRSEEGRSEGVPRQAMAREERGADDQRVAHRHDRRRPAGPRLGELPLARRDVERLQQLLGVQRRLRDLNVSPRARRALSHRTIFREALTWLEIHGGAPDIIEQWKAFLASVDTSVDLGTDEHEAEPRTPRRRRRRRRRRFRPAPQ
jgi:poly(A) polymerase